MNKLAMLLGAVTFMTYPLMADEQRTVGYGFTHVYIYPDKPGCTMALCDEETVAPFDDNGNRIPGYWGTHPTHGTVCTVYRNGEAIGTFLTHGNTDTNHGVDFTDYDVIPGETYTYEIRASVGRYQASLVFEQTCQYVYRVELGAAELLFDAEGGEGNKKRLSVSIYKQYKDSSVPHRFDGVGVTVYLGQSWIKGRFDWSSYPDPHTIDIWPTANDTGLAREGLVTVDISYTGHSYPVRIVQAAKEVYYSSWAAVNGVSGAWDAKDENGIYNVFRYAFGVPTGKFTETPLIDIAFLDGKPVIKTPAVVNASGLTLSVEASDRIDGTGNVASYPLNASGTTTVEEDTRQMRFFRLKATLAQ